MKYIFWLINVLGAIQLYGQDNSAEIIGSKQLDKKFIVDDKAIKEWSSLPNSEVAISSNGMFVTYAIANLPLGSKTLVVQATSGTWKHNIVGASKISFSYDSKTFVFQKGDSLFFLNNGSPIPRFEALISTYKMPRYSKGTWLACISKNTNELILFNLITGDKKLYQSVNDYFFDSKGTALLLKTVEKKDINATTLRWVSLAGGEPQLIFSRQNVTISGTAFDESGSQLIFTVNETETKNDVSQKAVKNSIWYYKYGTKEAVLKIDNMSFSASSNLKIYRDAPRFSDNGQYIFFRVSKQTKVLETNRDPVLVDVWSHKDVELQSTQLLTVNNERTYSMVLDIVKNRIISLEQHENERLMSASGDYAIVLDKPKENWWKNVSEKIYLFSFKSGERKKLSTNKFSLLSFSPKSNFIVYFDEDKRAYFSYNLLTNKVINITKSIPVSLEKTDEYLIGEIHGKPLEPRGIAAWQKEGSYLLIYDDYDIWKVDPKATYPPLNLTGGEGRKRQIIFRLLDNAIGGFEENQLMVVSFNRQTKENGFFSMDCKNVGLKKLTSEPYLYYRLYSQQPHHKSFSNGMEPVKAEEAQAWIVERQTSSDAPNLFFTRDFKKFNALTNLQPQRNYNWLRAELINWKQFDGIWSQGILYKPENFDSTRKYPLIFNYYEQSSHSLFEFPEPDFTKNNINIPWFVSRGYLVFTPDIHYKVGETGLSVYNTVVSAALTLSRNSWVDKDRMAIQGHSFGGSETNQLVSRTNIFAAAAEAAGGSDGVSSYLELHGGGGLAETSKLIVAEIGQGRKGGTLWQIPEKYTSNSPVLRADKINTPMLIMHNKADPSVSWRQGVELFLALHRLEKKVWMLQYDKGGHAVSGVDAKDYTIRLTQFFNHYLKFTPAPTWMTQGIPARLKGVITGYDLDPTGNCGKDCKVCKTWNDKYQNDSQQP